MLVQVLYFEGCPNHVPAVELARSVASEIGVEASIEEVEVRNAEEAEKLRFHGSPTIHVDGIDVEPAARERTDYSFSCRMYGMSGLPSREMMKAALLGEDQPAKSNGTAYAAVGSLLAAGVASACCWLPPILLLFGLSAAGVSATFASVRPWFLTGAFALLGIGFYLNYRRKSACGPGSSCPAPTPKLARFNRAMLWVALAGVLALAFIPKYVGVVSGNNAVALSPDARKVTLVIEGMTCESCASTLRKSLLDIPGVADASVSYESAEAIVSLKETEQPDLKALEKAVEDSGFRVSSHR